MKSDVIVVRNDEQTIEKALDLAGRVAAYFGWQDKQSLHVRLLTEEMIGLMRGITGGTQGDFWIEVENNLCMLHLRANVVLDSITRDRLLSTATSGKNEAAKGFMGWIRDLFDRSTDTDVASITAAAIPYEGTESNGALDWSWRLSDYRADLATNRYSSSDASKKWDELEKSVVAHVADDVKVSITGKNVEMIIYKKL